MGWKTTYITCSLISRHVRYYVGTLELAKKPGDTALHVVRANLPWGYLTTDGRTSAYIPDYQGNIRAVIDPAGTNNKSTASQPICRRVCLLRREKMRRNVGKI